MTDDLTSPAEAAPAAEPALGAKPPPANGETRPPANGAKPSRRTRRRDTPPAVEPPHPHPTRPDLVRRFTGAERALHWLLAADIAVLTLTGLGLYLGPGSNPVLGHRELVRAVHLDAAVGLLVLPVVIAGMHAGTLARLWREVEWFDADDWRWLRRILVPAFLRRRRPIPAQGRMNAGQKLNTIVVAAALVGFVGTGAVMYVGAHVPPSVADAADTWHVWLMYAGAPLVAGHIALAMLLPATRGAMRGILTGFVRRDYARRRHGRWAATETPPPDAAGEPAAAPP